MKSSTENTESCSKSSISSSVNLVFIAPASVLLPRKNSPFSVLKFNYGLNSRPVKKLCFK